MKLNKQVAAVVAGAVLLFGAAIGASFALIGNGSDGVSQSPAVHTMPGGQNMTGRTHEVPMDTTQDEQTMPGETMPPSHAMPGGQTMPGSQHPGSGSDQNSDGMMDEQGGMGGHGMMDDSGMMDGEG